MNVFELATKYYPLLWDIERIKELHKKLKLTDKEYTLITGEKIEGNLSNEE